MSHATSTPAIRIYDSASHHRRGSVPRRTSYASPSAIPMAIPNARESPPPPLPPPRHIGELSQGQDPGWQWGNTRFGPGSEGLREVSVRPGSSLLGSGWRDGQARNDMHSFGGELERLGSSRRGSSISTIKSLEADLLVDPMEPQDDAAKGGARRSPIGNPSRLQSERQLGQRSLANSSQAYDKQLLSKIGGPNTANRPSVSSSLSSSAQDYPTAPHTIQHKLHTQLKPLSMPERPFPSSDSSGSRWTGSDGVSPAQMSFQSPIYENSSVDPFGARRHEGAATPGPLDSYDSRSHRGSYEQGIFMDNEFAMDERGMRELQLHDRSPSGSDEGQPGPNKAGIKRRASSPPGDAMRDDRATTGGNDLYRRRSQQMLANRSSPVSRFNAHHGSVSSVSSLSQRTNSVTSSYGLSVASSNTSYSGERLSPLSPSVDGEIGPNSPYTASKSLNPSPRGSLSRPPQYLNRESDAARNRKMSSDSVNHSRQNSVTKMQGLYICECCPKKPKKFDGEEELRVHELEKQYTCAYCSNRFKNKNEAERHQNSLHLRRHSWSCAALAGVHAAFHQSSTHPLTADVCGYCGEEFPNPPDWEARAGHLNHVHKFGECNQAKKFFRADHFRQHLKHSHAGTSGKWTNMLENACMKDEPPPKEVVSSQGGSPSVSIGGSSLGSAQIPGVIDEVHDES